MRDWMVRQVRLAQRLNERFGQFMLEGKEERVLRFNHMEKRRVLRALEAIERAGAFKTSRGGPPCRFICVKRGLDSKTADSGRSSIPGGASLRQSSFWVKGLSDSRF